MKLKQLKKATAHLFNLRGHDLAYRIVDLLFERKLFTLYTWTGMSKSNTKRAFSGYTATLKFFQKIMHFHDKNYTEADVKMFFQKKNMHHCDRRSEKPILRASATKSRGGSIIRKRDVLKQNSLKEKDSSINIESQLEFSVNKEDEASELTLPQILSISDPMFLAENKNLNVIHSKKNKFRLPNLSSHFENVMSGLPTLTDSENASLGIENDYLSPPNDPLDEEIWKSEEYLLNADTIYSTSSSNNESTIDSNESDHTAGKCYFYLYANTYYISLLVFRWRRIKFSKRRRNACISKII